MSNYGGYGYYGKSDSTMGYGESQQQQAQQIGGGGGGYGEPQRTSYDEQQQQPYAGLVSMVGQPSSIHQEVSYDTSSKDPHMIRARVFIGNIARAIVTRDEIIDLFQPFGTLMAVNYFAQQGFAFIQFTEATDADKSCLTLNGKQWKGCVLDVHLAMLGKKAPTAPTAPVGPPSSSIGASILSAETNQAKAASKRGPDDEEFEIFKQNKRNKLFMMSDKTNGEDLAPNEMCDTMVCGNCRYVTSDFEEFKNHRMIGCRRYSDQEEPKHRLKCATCNQRFLAAWALLEHLTEFHRMLLYSEEPIPREKSTENGNGAGGATSSTETSQAQTEGAPVVYNEEK
ncbi:unnamed protein product [Caenorhabditis angaria]|uniref:RRM domain-containing protein n=1 Tax=Caenorhabditis angaria TaxID=860376 RepID=A0A9P1I8G7_9PELO|nr:unnamed protein product [Caenorhabditis angaria]